MKKRVLIVDDSRTTRNFHAEVMRSGGYDVDTAMDGSEALERLLSGSFDLVLTDINMQGMDGYEFIRRVRAGQRCARLPIIIISTDGEDSDKTRGFRAGADLYLVKPSDPSEVLAQVNMLLSS